VVNFIQTCRFAPAESRAGNRNREGACKATGFPRRHFERAQGDDSVSTHATFMRRAND
jgi:hypothetical protein